MYVNVKLLNGFDRVLTYKIPESWSGAISPGSFVTVPLKTRQEKAFVIAVFDKLPEPVAFEVRELSSQHALPVDQNYGDFIVHVAHYYRLDPLVLYGRIQGFLREKKTRLVEQNDDASVGNSVSLSSEQVQAYDTIRACCQKGCFAPTVLHGVTGSGKTIVYQSLMRDLIEQGKSVIFLVPEVSLAVQFVQIFRSFFSKGTAIFGFHSATSSREKSELWSALLAQQPLIVVGVHLPVLLPIANLGLIIVDEEHEVGYQEKKHPKCNTRDIALIRAKKYGIPIVLGSATPSLSTMAKTISGEWVFVSMKERYAGQFPRISVISLTEAAPRKNFWLSRELERAIEVRLEKREQAIIFINRRGFSFCIQCAACGYLITCKHCSVSLTFHEDKTVRCHYCDYRSQEPQVCPGCSLKGHLMKKGIGTEQVVRMIEKCFPQARVARADLDATINRTRWSQTIEQFYNKDIDILVGTQTITKGYHFPGVTLVGILWGDCTMSLPFYNAAERTIQQLVQVAGRAGRQTQESEVVIQTIGKHELFSNISETDYFMFVERELLFRKSFGYPPTGRFVEIEIRNRSEVQLEHDAEQCRILLENYRQMHAPTMKILGPACPPVAKIQGVSMRVIYLKAPTFTPLHGAYDFLVCAQLTSSLLFVPNPIQ